MRKHLSRAGLLLVIVLLLIASAGCASSQDFDGRLHTIVQPYEFNTVKWESGALLKEARIAIFDRRQGPDDEVGTVINYFASVQLIRSLNSQIKAIDAGSRQGDPSPLRAERDRLQQETSSLKTVVERIVKKEIGETLARQGIFNPADEYLKVRVPFPPLNFVIEGPPHLLVVSPRDHIEKIRSITLQQSFSLEQMEGMEASVDKLGVSSLVVELGGFAGTYPSFVTDRADLQFTVETIAHEWLHQYLAFKPLGFAYILDLTGIAHNNEIVTINETVAGMFGREIASLLYEEYYGRRGEMRRRPDTESEFNREMRQTRRTVDQYLAKGEIEQAEKFMEQERQYLASRGYYIRKLNQAYFAFYGTYADSPTSINPIGSELRTLRSKQKTLKDFLETVSVMTSRKDLANSIR